MSLKKKTISGMAWSFIDIFAKQGVTFVIGIILARLLSPEEFGLIGMTTIFIVLSESVMDSGFGQALVRKKECTQVDYSTVFYFNLVTGILFFFLIFFSADFISNFFNEPKLRIIIQVLGAGLIIKSLSIIQSVILIKRINFKLQTKISILASVGSGILGIFLAYQGFGVWSLVVKVLSGFTITTILLWIWNNWKPSFIFSWDSFKTLFSFGSKLLMSGLIKRAYDNVYLVVVGKFFYAEQLGFFTRANQFNQLVSRNLTMAIQRVSYPVLSSIQDDIQLLRITYRQLIKSTMLLTFFSMIGLIVIAKPLILVLIGEKWLPSVIYLQLLCFVGIFFPLQEINQNMLKVQGRSDIILKLEIVKKILVIPIIYIGILYGIKVLIIGMIFMALVSYLVDSFFAGRLIDYSGIKQMKDIYLTCLCACIAGFITLVTGKFLTTSIPISLMIQSILYAVVFLSICEVLKIEEYKYVKQILVENYLKMIRRNKA